MRTPADSTLALAPGLSREFLLHNRVCPKGRAADGRIVVALGPDALESAIDDVSVAYRCAVTTEGVSLSELERLIERLATRDERTLELTPDGDSDQDALTTDTRSLANQPPVVRYVSLLIREAHDVSASDIHLEATRTGLAARFRVDGVLTPAPDAPPNLHHAIVSRIKLLAELDIAERRRPQDGRVRVRLESRELDLRVSCVPTMHGESIVLRLLDRGGRPVTLKDLGMPASVLTTVERLARRPHGMILVTGPTGSGKTTTLYAALQQRSLAAEKTITVEDPIEYQLPGITQVPVHRQAGVTFAGALRSILRQDPDVLMVGEMRDGEAAEIAVQAAMTGHLVFSTLHTNDAISAIPRLKDLGVQEYLVAATLEGVLAQRLVRRICDECRTPYSPSDESIALLGGCVPAPFTLTKGEGCTACRFTGFRGRIGLFELLTVTPALRSAIAHGASSADLQGIAEEDGMEPLTTDGWLKVQAGLTTVEEVLRVVQG